MMGNGKFSRYELHPPMSLGDVLAALFRRKPKTARAARLVGPGQRAEDNSSEPTQLVQYEDSQDEKWAGLLMK